MKLRIVSLLMTGVLLTSVIPPGVANGKGNGRGRGQSHKQHRGGSPAKGHSRHPGVASGHHVRHQGNRGRQGGFGYLNIDPTGVGFSYYGRQFGIDVGPLFFSPGYYDPASDYGTGPAPLFVEHYDDAHLPQENLPATVIATLPVAAEYQRRAEEAFRTRRYRESLRFAEHALVDDSHNGKLHLFLSQALLAVGRYEAAAVALRRGMSLLDEPDWGFVVANYDRFYDDVEYAEQMERLVVFTEQNPNNAHALLVCGYHYTFLGYPAAARQQLTTALELEPHDQAAQRLLALLGESLPAPTPSGELDVR